MGEVPAPGRVAALDEQVASERLPSVGDLSCCCHDRLGVRRASHALQEQFGTDDAWDTLEEVLLRVRGEQVSASLRSRMAVAGREVLHWLAHPHILIADRPDFETRLQRIAEYAEEWLTSARSLGLAQGRPASERGARPRRQRGAVPACRRFAVRRHRARPGARPGRCSESLKGRHPS